MKKTLQINIGGLLFTIEEDAYVKLNDYLNSLKRYFSTYESCDEIVQDIETRIAEKFYEKKQNGVIELEDVEKIIATMGTVSDFEAVKEEEDLQQEKVKSNPHVNQPFIKGLYRDGKRKALGGVLAGIAHKYEFDVVWARIAFLTFALGLITEGVGPFFILLYFIAWIVLPVRNDLSDNPSVRKFYRNPDDKVIGGVASGLASFLKVDVKIVRIVFVISGFLVIGIIIYLLFWIVAPLATSLTQKLQLEGQPVTIENIEKSVKIKEGPQEQVQESTLSKIVLFPFRLIGVFFSFLGKLVGPIATLLKIFAGVIIIILGISISFSAMVALGAFFGVMNANEWISTGSGEFNQILREIPSYGAIFAFFTAFVPGLALIIAGIMLIAKKVIGNKNFWASLLLLWLVGIIGTTSIATQFSINFNKREVIETEHTYDIPKEEVLVLDASKDDIYSISNRPGFDISSTNLDKLYLNKQLKSNGPTEEKAKQFASNIQYNIVQTGATLVFDNTLRVKDGDPFRDQDVRLKIEIPVGKKFRFSKRFLESFGYPYHSFDDINKDYSGENTFVFEDNGRVVCLDCPESDPYEVVDEDFDFDRFAGDFENVENRSYNKKITLISSFDEIKAAKNFKILYVKGDSLQVSVFSDNETNVNETTVKVQNGKLIIGYEDPFKNYDYETFVKITSPKVSNVSLENGAKLKMYGFEDVSRISLHVYDDSKAAMHVNAKQVNLNIGEKSNVLLQGEIADLQASLSEKSILKATKAKITVAQINAKSSSIAELGKVKTKNLNADKGSVIKAEDY